MVLGPQMQVSPANLANRAELRLGFQRNQPIRCEHLDATLLAESLESTSSEKSLFVGLCHTSTVQGRFREVPDQNGKHLGDSSAKGYDTEKVAYAIRGASVSERPD
jgi:hypothetical protein